MATLLEAPIVSSLGGSSSSNTASIEQITSHGSSFGFPSITEPETQSALVATAPDVEMDDTEEEVRPRKERRIKGRRRAINPLPHVESALRRQQELKTNFRLLARPLKLILQELARRTSDDLTENQLVHEQVPEAEQVKQALRKRLDDRLRHVKLSDELQKAHLKQTYDGEQHVRKRRCLHSVQSLQEASLDVIDSQAHSIERKIDPKQEKVSDLRTSIPPGEFKVFDSHLRHHVPENKVVSVPEVQGKMHFLLGTQGYLTEQMEYEELLARRAAEARQIGMQNMNSLLRAGHQVQHEAQQRNLAAVNDPANRNTPLSLLAEAGTFLSSPAGQALVRAASMQKHAPMTPAGRHGPRPMVDGRRAETMPYGARGKRPRNTSHTKVMHTPYEPVRHESYSSLHKNSASFVKPERRSPSPPIDGRMRTNSMPIKSASSFFTPGGRRSPERQSLNERPPFVPSRSLDAQAGDSRPGPRFDRMFSILPPALGSPFNHRPGSMHEPPPGRPPAGHDTFRFRTIDYNPREGQAPRPPTAQPVNHFANLANYQPSRPLRMSPTIAASPLVALPPNRNMPRPPFSLSHGLLNDIIDPQRPDPTIPAIPPLSGVLHRPPPPAPPAQFGGPMLAPAAVSRTAQPAFAQQMDRQEQNRKKNTEVFPRFRPYHGPPSQS